VTIEADAATLLEQATAILDRYGWIQGATYDVTSRRFDLLGALAYAAGIPRSTLTGDQAVEGLVPLAPPARQAALACAYDECDGILGCDPIYWSDMRGRTYRQVRWLMLDAAAVLRIRHA